MLLYWNLKKNTKMKLQALMVNLLLLNITKHCIKFVPKDPKTQFLYLDAPFRLFYQKNHCQRHFPFKRDRHNQVIKHDVIRRNRNEHYRLLNFYCSLWKVLKKNTVSAAEISVLSHPAFLQRSRTSQKNTMFFFLHCYYFNRNNRIISFYFCPSGTIMILVRRRFSLEHLYEHRSMKWRRKTKKRFFGPIKFNMDYGRLSRSSFQELS